MKNIMLDETIIIKQLSSGIKCYIIPKKGFKEKHAVIATNFGAVDQKFSINNSKIEIPDGVAHFLEHKMFEDKKINIMEEFSDLGADVNAYTNYTNTAYYFSCMDNFDECFKLLINCVCNPFFTDENVENEKSIISQEILMYEDYPGLKSFTNMIKNMYENKAFSKNISGTVDSIKKIDKEMLYKCYESFYFPENMAIICVGDFDEQNIYDTIENEFSLKNNHQLTRIFNKEKISVVSNFVEYSMNLPNTIFSLGFKEDMNLMKNSSENTLLTKILLDIMFGESSDFYNNMYSKSLIDNTFNTDYNNFLFFGCSIIAGISKNPVELKKYIFEQIQSINQVKIQNERFEQIKKKHIGAYIREFNNLENISTIQVDLFANNTNIIEFMDCFENLTLEKINMRLKNHLLEENSVLSVVR